MFSRPTQGPIPSHIIFVVMVPAAGIGQATPALGRRRSPPAKPGTPSKICTYDLPLRTGLLYLLSYGGLLLAGRYPAPRAPFPNGEA